MTSCWWGALTLFVPLAQLYVEPSPNEAQWHTFRATAAVCAVIVPSCSTTIRLCSWRVTSIDNLCYLKLEAYVPWRELQLKLQHTKVKGLYVWTILRGEPTHFSESTLQRRHVLKWEQCCSQSLSKLQKHSFGSKALLKRAVQVNLKLENFDEIKNCIWGWNRDLIRYHLTFTYRFFSCSPDSGWYIMPRAGH